VRALLAHKRGEPRVCAMVRAPTPQEEDRRRICRERIVLLAAEGRKRIDGQRETLLPIPGKRGRKRRASQLPDSRAAEEGWMIGGALAVSPGQ